MSKKKMTKQEIEDWNELYQYVKTEIMQYHDKKLSSYFVLRLKGLSDGKFCANKHQKSYGSYDFKTILYTFKICKPNILKAFANTVIKDGQHRINLIMVIVEREINDVVDRINRVNQTVEKIEAIELPQQDNERAEYKAKPRKENKHLDDLW